MGTAVIGALRADLSANSAVFAADLAKARQSLASFGSRANQSLAALDRGFGKVSSAIGGVVGRLNPLHALLGAVSVGGMAYMVKSTLDWADALAKAADSIGVSTTALQEFRFAASLAGVSQEQLDSGLGAFVKRIGELRAGTGTLTTFLDKFDGGLKSALLGARDSSEALRILFDRAAATGNAFDRAALMSAAFGRGAGQAMTNMIDGTKEAIDEARRLGIVIEERLLRQAEATNDKMEILATVLKMKVSAAILENAQLIGNLTDALIAAIPKVAAFVDEWSRYFGLVEAAPGDKLGGYLKGLNDRGAAVVAQLKAMRDEAEAFETGLANMQDMLPADHPYIVAAKEHLARYQALKAELAVIRDLTDQALASMNRLDQAGAAAAPAAASGSVPAAPAAGRAVVLDRADAEERAKAAAQVYEDAMKRITDRVKAAQDAHEAFAARGLQVWQETRTPLEAYNAKVRELNLLNQQGFIDQDTLNRSLVLARLAYNEASGAVEQASRSLEDFKAQQESAKRLSGDMAQAFGSAMDSMMDSASSASGVLRSLLRDMLSVLNRNFVGPGIESVVGSALSGLTGLLGGGGQIGGGMSGGIPLPMLAGARAGGGPVSAGQAYLVGEREPEVFVPDRPGQILNQAQLGGPAIHVTYNLDARGADAGVTPRLQAMLDRTKAETIQTVMALMEDGGRMARASGRRGRA